MLHETLSSTAAVEGHYDPSWSSVTDDDDDGLVNAFEHVCVYFQCFVLITGGERQVFNLAPFTDKHFRIRGLGDTVKDLHNLLYLYPDIPKARTFSKFWAQGWLLPLTVLNLIAKFLSL